MLRSALLLLLLLFLPAHSATAHESGPGTILSYLRTTKVEGVRSTWDFVYSSIRPSKKAPPIVVLYLTNAGWCGTGGCHLLILSLKNGKYKTLARTLAESPITLLGRTNDGYPILGLVYKGHWNPGGTMGLDFGELRPKDGVYPDGPNRLPNHSPRGRVLISEATVICNFRHLPPGPACQRLVDKQWSPERAPNVLHP